MPILVMKFGGTSVASLDRIRRAAKRVGREVANGYDVIVIVSAMAGKTNELVGWVEETSHLYDAREYDAVVSSGENVTAGLMALTLQEMNIPARSWQGLGYSRTVLFWSLFFCARTFMHVPIPGSELQPRRAYI